MPVVAVNSSYNGRHIPRFPSPVDGPGMALSVDVCKIPAPPAPFLPVPYPTPTTAWGTSAASKQAVTQQLKTRMQSLHGQIASMCSYGDATAVHKAVDEYVDAVSKLYVLMGPPMDVKVEGRQVVRRFP